MAPRILLLLALASLAGAVGALGADCTALPTFVVLNGNNGGWPVTCRGQAPGYVCTAVCNTAAPGHFYGANPVPQAVCQPDGTWSLVPGLFYDSAGRVKCNEGCAGLPPKAGVTWGEQCLNLRAGQWCPGYCTANPSLSQACQCVSTYWGTVFGPDCPPV